MSVLITIDAASPVPAFEQVRAQLATLISTGALTPGQRLPTGRQLARDLGTIGRAIRALEQAGLVHASGSRGTTVTGPTDRPTRRLGDPHRSRSRPHSTPSPPATSQPPDPSASLPRRSSPQYSAVCPANADDDCANWPQPVDPALPQCICTRSSLQRKLICVWIDGMVDMSAWTTLDRVREVQQRTRRYRFVSAWLPLAVFGVVMTGADHVARSSHGIAMISVGNGGFRENKHNWLANIAGSPASVPVAIYWLVAMPVAFLVSGVWLRSRTGRDGIAHRWRLGAVVALGPFAALVLLRMVLEPAFPALHDALSYGNRGGWLPPQAFFLLGIVAWSISTRIRSLIAACSAIAGLNLAWFIIQSGGAGSGSVRYEIIHGVVSALASLRVGILGASAYLLLACSAGWFAASRLGWGADRG